MSDAHETMAPMMTNRFIRGWTGMLFIAAGVVAAIASGLALMNLFGSAGPVTIFGVIGGLCAIATGARWVREATRPEDAASAAEPQQLV